LLAIIAHIDNNCQAIIARPTEPLISFRAPGNPDSVLPGFSEHEMPNPKCQNAKRNATFFSRPQKLNAKHKMKYSSTKWRHKISTKLFNAKRF